VHTFDFSPLTAPVDKSAVSALRREAQADKVKPSAADEVITLWVGVVGFVVAAGLLVLVDFGSVPVSLVAKILWTALMGSLGTVLFAGVVYSVYRLLVRWTQFYRAKQFAAANGMTYAVSESKPTWDSRLFQVDGLNARASNVFTATSEPVFEVGNYHYENWSNKKLVGIDWGYLVVDLGRPYAPIVLRSMTRQSLRRWSPDAYARNPVLPVATSVDRKFQLYCPVGAEDDARRLFTPQLITALARIGRTVNAEVAGQFLFVYSGRRFPFPRPRAVKAVFAVISLVTDFAA
jgi:hypothetical protein